MKVAVVILNWNGQGYLEKFFPSVITHTANDAEIFVADNASTDDSISFLHANFPQVKIIKNSENGGFAKGYNQALKNLTNEYFVLLNSDVEVTPNWISLVIEMMDKDKSIAACQPKIKSYQDKNLFEYAGAAGGFIDKYGYPFCRGRIFHSFERDAGQYDNEKEILWASGACLFIRSEVFNIVGGFDEDFFAHMEEIDLCWRIKNMGWKIMFCPQSAVYHVGGGTLPKINPQKTFLNFRNNLYLLLKNHNTQYFWIKLFIRFLWDGIAAVRFIFSLQFNHFMAVLKAHYSFYLNFSKTIKKRKKLKQNIKAYTTTAVYRKSIVVDYFIRGKTKFSELDKTKF